MWNWCIKFEQLYIISRSLLIQKMMNLNRDQAPQPGNNITGPSLTIGKKSNEKDSLTIGKLSIEKSKQTFDDLKQDSVCMIEPAEGLEEEKVSGLMALTNQNNMSRDKGVQDNQSSFNNDFAFQNPFPQGQEQIALGQGTTTREKLSHFNIFSNSFDESGMIQIDQRPQRNCKSSTRKLNKTQNPHASKKNPSDPNSIHLNNIQVQDITNNIQKSLIQNQYHQQALKSQLQRVNVPGFNQSEYIQSHQLSQDLSNRSHLVQQSQGTLLGLSQTPYHPMGVNSLQSQYNIYGGAGPAGVIPIGAQSSSSTSSKPKTPHQNLVGGNNSSTKQFQSVILSAGSHEKELSLQQTPQSQNNNQMDPYTYFKWKQQKYKSSRSIQNPNIGNGSGYGGAYHMQQNPGIQMNQNPVQFQRQNSNSKMSGSQNFMINGQMNGNQGPYPQFQHHSMRPKGNQTSKNNKSRCSSGNGSIMNTSSTGLTIGGQPIKSLTEVANPQYFITLRFHDRKVTDLNGLNLFKNLSELDISGNLLTQEIPELKSLQFLKKLNLSNNQIDILYQVPSNLEILNLSYNKLKFLNTEVTANLKNLTTLEISSNGLESLEGIQSMKRLKRLISKNNQIQNVSQLNDMEGLIEIDLENNPVDSYHQVLCMIQKKKDLLVINLKLSPVLLTISSYEQLISELETFIADKDELNQALETFKNKLKHYAAGSLYRSKRTYLKLKNLQQQTKRSSSQFSNGSSSCGRANAQGAGGLTGGRMKANQVGAPFSPMVNPNPINANVTQRYEEFDQLYDEILDQEEEQERKMLKIQKRKMKKQNNEYDSGNDDEDLDESLSMYEEEDDDLDCIDDEDIHPTMSFEEDVEELQSYRNHAGAPQQNQNDFLNESTADFNKQIKQIHQELREQYGNDLGGIGAIMEGTAESPLDVGNQDNAQNPADQLQSFQSTQSLNETNGNKKSQSKNNTTQKKNPISFKLDLSKCTNQHSEEDDEEDYINPNQILLGLNDDNGGAPTDSDTNQFEIPSLQFVKVIDDSFRQKQQIQRKQKQAQNDEQTIQEKSQRTVPNSTQEISIIPKQPIKQVVIPKLQLSALNQHHNIPLKQFQTSHLKQLSQIQSLRSGKAGNSTQNDSKRAPVPPQQPLPQEIQQIKVESSCKKPECCRLRDAFIQLQGTFEKEKDSLIKSNESLQSVINQIKVIFKLSARDDITRLPSLISDFKLQSQSESQKANSIIQNLQQKCDELNIWREEQEVKLQAQEKSKDLQIQCQEKEKTITHLKDQISKLMLTQRHQTNKLIPNSTSQPDGLFFKNVQEVNDETLPMTSFGDMKRTFSSKYQHSQALDQPQSNPTYFYNSQSHNMLLNQNDQNALDDDKAKVVKLKAGKKPQGVVIEGVRQKAQEVGRKVKRPQSVVAGGINQRRSSQGLKINNVLRIENNPVMNQSTYPLQIFKLNEDASVGANEYCSNQDIILPIDLSLVNQSQPDIDSKGVPLSQTMNRKVGHYLQRLKERNSSLQERLNGSFRDGSGSHSAFNAINSPTPLGVSGEAMLNLHLINNNNQETISSNPYILSPNNHKYNESISSKKPTLAIKGTNEMINNYQTVKSNDQLSKQIVNQYQNQSLTLQGKQVNLGASLLRQISSKESNGFSSNSRRQSNTSTGQPSNFIDQASQQHQHVNRFTVNEYSERNNSSQQDSQNSQSTMKQHSKTQRIHVNRVQYNQIFGATGRGQGLNSSLNKNSEINLLNTTTKQTSNHHPPIPPLPLSSAGAMLQGYHTHQHPQTAHSGNQHINLTQLFSGRQRNDSSLDRSALIMPKHNAPVIGNSAAGYNTIGVASQGSFSGVRKNSSQNNI